MIKKIIDPILPYHKRRHYKKLFLSNLSLGSVRSNWKLSNKFHRTILQRMSLFLFVTRLERKAKFTDLQTRVVEEKFLNFKICAYDYFTLNLLIKEIFFSHEYYFETNVDHPMIIDCGANIGISVLYFKMMFPHSKILAFEPNPHAYQLLKRNININKLENVEIKNVALYDEEKEISFFISNLGAPNASVRKDRGGERELIVKTQKLSSYLQNVEIIDLIKIDVEGAESNIIDDLVKTSTLNKAKTYLIEYHHNINQDRSKLSVFLKKFESHGFSYNLRTNYIPGKRFQDIFIHFYRESFDNSSI